MKLSKPDIVDSIESDTPIGDLYSWREGYKTALDEVLKILEMRPITIKEEIQLLKGKLDD